MGYISIDNLIQEQLFTPEQEILCQQFYAKFDCQPAVALLNKKIINVEPLFFMGSIVGSEFLTYAATKMYLCFAFQAVDYQMLGAVPGLKFYDENNAYFYPYQNSPGFYDGAQPAFVSNADADLINFWFACIGSYVGYSHIKFTGYRITLV